MENESELVLVEQAASHERILRHSAAASSSHVICDAMYSRTSESP